MRRFWVFELSKKYDVKVAFGSVSYGHELRRAETTFATPVFLEPCHSKFNAPRNEWNLDRVAPATNKIKGPSQRSVCSRQKQVSP